MTKCRLSVGSQIFRRVPEPGCYCVDKTACIERPLDEGTHYFVSRRRRFIRRLRSARRPWLAARRGS